jgi:tellurite resistance protein TehA-like permease
LNVDTFNTSARATAHHAILLYWGMVFPLGMYTVCTLQLSKAIGFQPLSLIPRYFVFVAIAAWLAIFVGFVRRLLPWKTEMEPPRGD